MKPKVFLKVTVFGAGLLLFLCVSSVRRYFNPSPAGSLSLRGNEPSDSFFDELVAPSKNTHLRILSNDDGDDEETIDFCKSDSEGCLLVDPAVYLIFYFFLLFYTFVGIAIVCDDLFVPALEMIAEKLEISNDVAGATLMAAGGSAPELATSFIGTFQQSDIGFGTIVGSAVFNVLFVIGACVLLTPDEKAPLILTWWPLARDCTYYILTLATLAAFMHDSKIEVWEACVQFILYIGYVLLMKFSSQIEAMVKRRLGIPIAVAEDEDPENPNFEFENPNCFHLGVLQVLSNLNNIADTAAVACVTRIKGDARAVFREIDTHHRGRIELEDMKTLLKSLGRINKPLEDSHVRIVCKQIDPTGKDCITEKSFVDWYLASQKSIRERVREVFDKLDQNKSGTISCKAVKCVLNELGNNPSIDEISLALRGINETEEINFQEFNKWYCNALFWTDVEEDEFQSMGQQAHDKFMDLFSSEVSVKQKAMNIFTIPLIIILMIVPDCRLPGKEGLRYFTFFGSILAIGAFAYVMVDAASKIGATLGIPDVVMGITVLAAGTSVPDLLSSVIVARQGEGDMAVSSSIGSNIFDVTVGLPLPWLTFNIVTVIIGCERNYFRVSSDGRLFEYLSVLLGMVVLVIGSITIFKFKMSRGLGFVMFLLYFVYVAYVLARTDNWAVASNC